MQSIKTKDFFTQIALNARVTDMDLVRDVYYGMIKTMARELRDRQAIILPNWGKFYITLHKSHNARCINKGTVFVVPPRPTVKFAPTESLKKHFYTLGETLE